MVGERKRISTLGENTSEALLEHEESARNQSRRTTLLKLGSSAAGDGTRRR